MAVSRARERFTLRVQTGGTTLRERLARDVRAGLAARPKSLPCCYFYDDEGSRLFERICGLREYYLPAAEREILAGHATEIASIFRERPVLIELGSGGATKTRVLIDALVHRYGTLEYAPIDISRSALVESAPPLLKAYAGLEIHAVAGDYLEELRRPAGPMERPKLIVWLGSSIGNLDRVDAAAFLGGIGNTMVRHDRLLVGIDLRKDRAVLQSAYDDAQGITARFNLNLLARINRELGGAFDLGAFRHRAVYNESAGRIEMYLVSTRDQTVPITSLDLSVPFAAGETVHTEHSYKYSTAEIEALAAAAGLRIEVQWYDEGRQFSVNLFAPGTRDTSMG
jgi:L-histidine Nalpha-methyltransferase